MYVMVKDEAKVKFHSERNSLGPDASPALPYDINIQTRRPN